jgi:hypothetical protein
MTSFYHGFLQSVQASAGVVIRSQPLLSCPFPIHHSLIIISSDAV